MGSVRAWDKVAHCSEVDTLPLCFKLYTDLPVTLDKLSLCFPFLIVACVSYKGSVRSKDTDTGEVIH